MSRDEVLKLWRQRPFVPFRITTVVGETIDVMHPGLMLVGGHTITVGTPDPHRHLPPTSYCGLISSTLRMLSHWTPCRRDSTASPEIECDETA